MYERFPVKVPAFTPEEIAKNSKFLHTGQLPIGAATKPGSHTDLAGDAPEVPHLFRPITFRGLTLQNRIAVSPMCMYSSENGIFNDFHLAHYGRLILSGYGLVTTEATAVAPGGRISLHDAGIWDDAQIPGLKRIIDLAHAYHTPISVQIGHAGRKASTGVPWEGTGDHEAIPPSDPRGWEVIGPSAIPFNEKHNMPHAMTIEDIRGMTQNYIDAARRVNEAGADVIELHFAHGYLASSFLSPLSNTRTDQYGGSFENRTRFLLETVRAVRGVWPKEKPLFARISATEWVPEGPSWDIDESVKLSKLLVEAGVDLIDVSSGGNNNGQTFPKDRMDFQLPLSERIHQEARVQTGTVGFIVGPKQANDIIATNKADIVFLARETLRNPGFPLQAAQELGTGIVVANQYARAGLKRPVVHKH